MARLAGRWVCLLVLLALGACSSWQAPQYEALLTQPPAGLAARAEQTEAPFFAQTDLQCGPAALATALGQVGMETAPAALSSQLFVPERGGSLQIEMLVAARRQGAVSTRLPPSLPALLQEVAAGQTPVVLLNLGLGLYPVWHYAVVVGYDLPLREVYLRSGQTRRLVMPMFTFEHTWQRSGHWAFTALRPGQWPVTAEPADVVEAAVAFERVQRGPAAVLAYRTALARQPGQLTLQLGLGNALLAAGDAPAAATAFEDAAQAHDSAAAWNNLAMVRSQRGLHLAAREAALRAVRRAELSEPAWLKAAQATLAEVDAAGATLPDNPTQATR